MDAILAFDQCAKVGHGRDYHVDGLQVAGSIQLFQHAAGQCGKTLFVDGVEAGKAILRAVIQLDIEDERLQQLAPAMRPESPGLAATPDGSPAEWN